MARQNACDMVFALAFAQMPPRYSPSYGQRVVDECAVDRRPFALAEPIPLLRLGQFGKLFGGLRDRLGEIILRSLVGDRS
jgi:hypothetical protein